MPNVLAHYRNTLTFILKYAIIVADRGRSPTPPFSYPRVHCYLKGKIMEALIIVFGIFAGLFLGVFFLAMALLGVLAVAPLLKSSLSDEPDKPKKFAVFTAPEPGRSSIIMRGNRIEHIIHGKDKDETLGEDEQFKNGFLRAYDAYAFKFGLRLIGFPGVHHVLTYNLPRNKKIEKDGNYVYVPVKADEDGYHTNHFRTQINTWISVFKSVDIEGLPFTVICGTNFRCDKGEIEKIAFGTESWNTLLDQSLYSVARGIIREKATLEDAVGGISQDVWKEHEGNETRPEKGDESIVGKIFNSLLEYKLKNGETLKTLGIIIESFEVLDYVSELNEEDLKKFYAPGLERRVAQARELAGTAEAAYQDKVLTVLDKHPDLAKANVDAEAFVRASKGGQMDALIAGLIKKILS